MVEVNEHTPHCHREERSDVAIQLNHQPAKRELRWFAVDSSSQTTPA